MTRFSTPRRVETQLDPTFAFNYEKLRLERTTPRTPFVCSYPHGLKVRYTDGFIRYTEKPVESTRGAAWKGARRTID